MLDICLPGTGGMIPLPERWLSCCWLEYQGRAILIDCGEGTQIALRKAGCRLSRLELLLVTHYHADHIAGLPGLLLTLGNSGKKTKLTIVGPRGLKTVVSALTIIAGTLPYEIELIEINGETDGVLEDGELAVSYRHLSHGVPCLGYRISFRRKPVFNPEKADRLNIPKKLYSLLHGGQAVRLDDGRVIAPDMVLDGPRMPLSVAFITDSLPTSAMPELARGVDLLVCEGMYGDEEMHGKMQEKGHMVFSDSARLAKKAGAKQLWLTHFSPAMKDPSPYLDGARVIFPNTSIGFDGMKTSL